MTIIILPILLLLLLCVMIGYNQLVRKKNMMKEAWSGIEVYLKKRYDLIPNLISTVKGYASHEQQLMENIARQRTEAMQSHAPDKIGVETHLAASIGQLLVIAENYPDLKANSVFLQLQSQLQTIESEIEMSRRYYNGTVRENNIRVESFPWNLVAKIFGFQKGTFFEIQNAAERENQTVSF